MASTPNTVINWREIVPGKMFQGLHCPDFTDENGVFLTLKRAEFGPQTGPGSEIAGLFYNLYILRKRQYDYAEDIKNRELQLSIDSGDRSPEIVNKLIEMEEAKSAAKIAEYRALLSNLQPSE